MDGILQEEQISIAETIGDTVERFLAGTKNGVACLKEIYQATTKWPQESVRCSIYRDRKKRFKRVAKGVYLLTGEKSASLLIHGDGRKLDEIEDGSISAIINDHPWKNEKAHKSGNQKCFADYDTFCYTQEDFDQKARVLVNGGYLAEFLPVRSFSNKEYLNRIEMMAEKAGLDYYASILWRKAPEGKINTGRTTKGIEQIVIFTKGKARCLNAGGKAYQTTNILTYEVDIPANKGKMKTHQAEKPIPLYEYLIEQLTREGDICLDQFGGSCNMAKASVLKNRFALIYEVCREFVESAVRRFNMLTLCECSEEERVMQEETPVEQEVYTIETIPAEVTAEQIEFLRKVLQQRPELLMERERATVENQDSQIVAAREIHEIYQAVNERGYSIRQNEDTTFKEYLVYWFQSIFVERAQSTTQYVFAYVLYDLLFPYLDETIKLRMVSTEYLNQLLKQVSTCCQSAGNKSREFLYLAMKDAVVHRFISNNPVIATKKYPRKKSKITILTKEQTKTLLAAAKYRSWFLEILLGLYCGMRKGEILGLKFSDFDLENRTVHIQRQLVADIKLNDNGLSILDYTKIERDPKTENGNRAFGVPPIVLVELEKRRRAIQLQKELMGEAYIDSNYISSQKNGLPRGLSSMNTELNRLCARNNLPHITVHSLRHMFATIMMERGLSIAKVSGLLGHSSVHTTFEYYVEIMDSDTKMLEYMNQEFIFEQ